MEALTLALAGVGVAGLGWLLGVFMTAAAYDKGWRNAYRERK